MAKERTDWDSTISYEWYDHIMVHSLHLGPQHERDIPMAKFSVLGQLPEMVSKANFHVSSVLIVVLSTSLGWWLIQLGFNEDSKVKSRLQGVSAHRYLRHSLVTNEEKRKISLLENCRCLLSLWIFRKALRSWNVSTHPYSIFSFFLLNKLLDFLNNKFCIKREGQWCNLSTAGICHLRGENTI